MDVLFLIKSFLRRIENHEKCDSHKFKVYRGGLTINLTKRYFGFIIKRDTLIT